MPRLSAPDPWGELLLTVAPTIRPDDPGTIAQTIPGDVLDAVPDLIPRFLTAHLRQGSGRKREKALV